MSHLMSVSAIVLEHGGNEDQAISGLLHDAVEDAPTGEGERVLEQIRKQFGETVARIVEACSDSLNEPTRARPPGRTGSAPTSSACATRGRSRTRRCS
jgi:(p)ppGpp synthase/HD superfamily hydrolase